MRLLLPFLISLVFSSSAVAQSRYIHFNFYSAALTFPAVPEMVFSLPEELSENVFQLAYAHFQEQNYHPYLKKVGDYRRGMRLSDWHFYQLIADYSEAMYPDEGRNFQVLFQWFILRKSGIDARLFHTKSEVYLHARSDEVEFGFFTIEKNGKKYLNLTAKRDHLELGDITAYMPDFVPDGATMSFTMAMTYLPTLPTPVTVQRAIRFHHLGEAYELNVFLNKDHLDMMEEYPYYNQSHYFQIALSKEAEASLLPQLEEFLAGRSPRERVEFILSFTRTAFFYLDDRRRYGKEKPMTPEQTLYHSYSDCEDRSALFYYLCRKLLDLPVIVLDFESHVGVAVELPGVDGDTYTYMGREFVYCEPTGPQDKLKIGQMWDHVRDQKARVLTEFIPQ